MLSYVFAVIILVSLVISPLLGNGSVLSQSIMDGASDAVSLLISLTGMMCFWSGILEIARQSKLTDKLARLFSVPLRYIFADVPVESKAFSNICMNISANLLGLSNAATPLGLQAMKELKQLSNKNYATDSMVNFVVMNTASIQLLPTTIAAIRQSLGSKNPFDILVCVWITSIAALAAGLTVSKLCCSFGRKKWTT